jgi:hypothetical protein
MEALMAAAEMFEGPDPYAPVFDSPPAPSIWDDALDVRVACL